MNYAIAGGTIVGAAQLNESLLDTITRRLRTGWRNLIDTLNHRGQP
ncbi:protease FtsH-inhibitory lysogeny factor CIII [Pantoea eucalypti]|nr:protease FtsH-inhibitory lysogeny factor CIII [Pantoea eucalypti]